MPTIKSILLGIGNWSDVLIARLMNLPVAPLNNFSYCSGSSAVITGGNIIRTGFRQLTGTVLFSDGTIDC